MKIGTRLIIFILLNSLFFNTFSQQETASCPKKIQKQIEEINSLIKRNRSTEAQILFNKKLAQKNCLEVQIVEAELTFKTGNRTEGLKKTHALLTSHPSNSTIKEKLAFLNLEMAETGKNYAFINGSLVSNRYVSPMNDREFARFHWQEAASGFESISDSTPPRLHLLGYIYKQLENYNKAQFYWEKLTNDSIYKQDVWLELSVIYLQTNQNDKYLQSLIELEKLYPRNLNLLSEFIHYYEGHNPEKHQEYIQKFHFYEFQPDILEIPYNETHFHYFQKIHANLDPDFLGKKIDHKTEWMVWILLKNETNGKTAYSVQQEIMLEKEISIDLLKEALYQSYTKAVWSRFAELIIQLYPKEAPSLFLQWEYDQIESIDFTTEKSWMILCQNSKKNGKYIQFMYEKAKALPSDRSNQFIKFVQQYLPEKEKKRLKIG